MSKVTLAILDTAPKFEEVEDRAFSGLQFGVFETADNIKYAARDTHARFVWVPRGEFAAFPDRYAYAIKFVQKNGEWVNREDDTLYKVTAKGMLELVEA